MKFEKFVCDLYSKVLNAQPGNGLNENLVLGPSSIYAAMLMVLTGSASNTRTELLEALKIDGNPNNGVVHAMYLDKLFSQFNKKIDSESEKYQYDDGEPPQLISANRIYVKQDLPIKDTFLQHLKECYEAEAKNVDFVQNSSAVANEVNEFVNKTTNGKIADIIQADELKNPDLALLLLNAIYFKGTWKKSFCESSTKDEPFHKLDSSTKTVPFMMDFTQRSYPLLELAAIKAKVLLLAFSKSEMHMAIILPDEKNGLAQVVNKLFHEPDQESLGKILSRNAYQNKYMDVKIPKFQINSTVELSPMLKEMGAPSAFNAQADFSEICSSGPGVHISKVRHKAFLKIDEYGAEAAAASTIEMMLLCLRQTEPFFADHPFLFMILAENMAPLFIGQVTDP